MLDKIYQEVRRYGRIESDIEMYDCGDYIRHMILFYNNVYYRFKLINGDVKELEVIG